MQVKLPASFVQIKEHYDFNMSINDIEIHFRKYIIYLVTTHFTKINPLSNKKMRS